MDNVIEKNVLTSQAGASIRIGFVTMVICCLLYPLVILGLGQTLTPCSANGSLVSNGRGQIIGSVLLAQGFSRPEYFWPRPSAVDYNAAAAGGSNLSPTNPELRERAKAQLLGLGLTADSPIPADLVTASGSGLDPHITLQNAEFQMDRVAAKWATNLKRDSNEIRREIEQILKHNVWAPLGGLAGEKMINVLEVNIELRKRYGAPL